MIGPVGVEVGAVDVPLVEVGTKVEVESVEDGGLTVLEDDIVEDGFAVDEDGFAVEEDDDAAVPWVAVPSRMT